jgi:hypothetical protein
MDNYKLEEEAYLLVREYGSRSEAIKNSGIPKSTFNDRYQRYLTRKNY